MATAFGSHISSDKLDACDDEELDALGFEGKRWARTMFLLMDDEVHLAQLLKVGFSTSLSVLPPYLLH